MKSSASESMLFQSRSGKGDIPDRARRKEHLRRSKLKQAYLIDDLDAELFMYLIQCIRVRLMKSSASESCLSLKFMLTTQLYNGNFI